MPRLNRRCLDVLEKDVEANRFAMELLVPTPFVLKEYDNIKANYDEMDIAKELAKVFSVDEALIGIKLKEMKIGFYGKL